MLWQPTGDNLFYNGTEFVKSGGLWLPASAAPYPFIGCDLGAASGMTWMTGAYTYTTQNAWVTDPKAADPEAIIKACQEFSEKYPKPAEDVLFGSPLCYGPSPLAAPAPTFADYTGFALSSMAKNLGLPSSLIYAKPESVSPALSWWADLFRGYDIDALPADPRVSLHPHPREITPERAREITGGLVE